MAEDVVMTEPSCPCRLVPSRIGIAWAKLASLPPCDAHVDVDTRQGFDALQDRLEASGRQEGGPLFSGVPRRWFEGPTLRFRCIHGHVHNSTDAKSIVAGECPTCAAPVALTFPEDS